MLQLSPEKSADRPAIDALLDQSFGPERGRKISYRFRLGVAPIAALSQTAHEDDVLVGTIRYWPIAIGGERHVALLLGPVAVQQGARSRGIGRRLIETTLAEARAAGHTRVLLVGDLAYYHRFGFLPSAGWRIAMPGERQERLLLLPLVDGAFDGVSGDIGSVAEPAHRLRAASRKILRASHPVRVVPQAA